MLGHSKQAFLVALGVGLLSTTFTACGPSCADIGCLEAVTVSLDRPLAGSGAYEVDVTADGTPMKCTTTLPGGRSTTCSDSRVHPFVDATGLVGMAVDGRIRSLRVTVLRDGAQVADGTFQPVYEGVEVNGPGCGTCALATAELTTS
jgi:hypothetical protein